MRVMCNLSLYICVILFKYLKVLCMNIFFSKRNKIIIIIIYIILENKILFTLSFYIVIHSHMSQLIFNNSTREMTKYEKFVYGINCNICVCLEMPLFILGGVTSKVYIVITWIIFIKAKFI